MKTKVNLDDSEIVVDIEYKDGTTKKIVYENVKEAETAHNEYMNNDLVKNVETTFRNKE